jgi:hypothetical protein
MTGDDATKPFRRVTTTTVLTKVTVTSKDFNNSLIQSHSSYNVIQVLCYVIVMKDAIDRHADMVVSITCSSLPLKRKERPKARW